MSVPLVFVVVVAIAEGTGTIRATSFGISAVLALYAGTVAVSGRYTAAFRDANGRADVLRIQFVLWSSALVYGIVALYAHNAGLCGVDRRLCDTTYSGDTIALPSFSASSLAVLAIMVGALILDRSVAEPTAVENSDKGASTTGDAASAPSKVRFKAVPDVTQVTALLATVLVTAVFVLDTQAKIGSRVVQNSTPGIDSTMIAFFTLVEASYLGSNLVISRQALRTAFGLVSAALVSAAFLVFSIVSLRGTGGGSSGFAGNIDAAMTSPLAFAAYGIVLAGMLGSGTRIVARYLSFTGTEGVEPITWLRSVVQVGIGGLVGFVVAFLVPMAVSKQPFIEVFNPWGLSIVAGIAGYGFQDSLRSIRERIVDQIRRGFEERSSENDIALGVAQGIERALAPAKPINYDAVAVIKVTDERDCDLIVPLAEGRGTSERPTPHVVARKTCRIKIRLVPKQEAPVGDDSAIIPIRISGGVDSPRVPLHIIADAGDDFSLQHRYFEAPVGGSFEIEEFRFEALSGEEANLVRPHRITVYQNGIYVNALAFERAPQ